MVEQRSLGKGGPRVGGIGYGAMVLEGYYGPSDDGRAVETVRRALDGGMTMIDSADAYGNGHNEELVGRAVRGRPDAFVATKAGIVFDEREEGAELPTGWGFSLRINGRPDYLRRALDASLARLGVDAVDLWYLHYPDPVLPIEESVGAMARAVEAGKVRHLGLSNVEPDQVRRAHAVHPIAAVQYEYSLWRREVEVELLPTLHDLGGALVAWSPLGSGFLTGTVSAVDPGDFRQNNPRFAGEVLARNAERFAPLRALAERLDVTPSQLALAWLLHQGPHVFPIPGTRTIAHLEENARAADVVLDAEALRGIDDVARPGLAEGATLL